MSCFQIFRLVFVIFSLYLMGDAFYRWDGFSYYAPFSEYLPSVALAYILWTIAAMLTTILIWTPFRLFEWLFNRIGLKIRMEHLLLHAFVFILLGALAWKIKTLNWPDLQTTLYLKFIVLICVSLVSLFPVWLFRNRAEQWMKVVLERITPLVWLFGISIIFFVPLVAYHTWFKGTDKIELQKISQVSLTDTNQPNILLVTYDALAAGNMSLYGYPRPTTPFINKWAEKASVFTKLEAESNFTAPTTASLMTGKRVWTHMRYHRMRGSRTVTSEMENLPVLLKKKGYFNMAFISNDIASVNNLGISNFFDLAPPSSEFWAFDYLPTLINKFLIPLFGGKFRIHDWLGQEDFITGKIIRRISGNQSHTSRPPEKAFNEFLSAVDNNLKKPFFAWIHVDPPHFPYLPFEPFMGMFDSSPEMRTLKSQLERKSKINEFKSVHQRFPGEVETLRARYDEFIRYSDKQFEDFIEQINKRDKLKNTIIILSADHGEIFEHNNLLHGATLYEPETHIPLIIKEPVQMKGRVIHDLVEQIDIPATILAMVNIPVPSWMEGRSLLPLMRGKKLSARPAFSMNLEENPSHGRRISKGTITVWDGDYKLIHHLGREESLLFNLNKDPEELNNVFDKDSGIGRRLIGLIRENLKKANERMRSGT